eukprot:TRINITY_DN19986_c0_g1_i1.p1 TRINITY_DN19986_c0_g1~~TRINITY_DN19986_c0_g1_i1.p1  ORF type:complete len:457 (+),score=70.41 TRINITY_DN19986_c0_g1_i1:68-1372(+)
MSSNILSQIRKQLPEIGRIPGVTSIDPPKIIHFATNDNGAYSKLEDSTACMVRIHIKGEGAYEGIHTINAKIIQTEASSTIRGSFVSPILHSDLSDDGEIPGQFKSLPALVASSIKAVTTRSNNPQANSHWAVTKQSRDYKPFRKNDALFTPGHRLGFSSKCLDPELLQAIESNNIRKVIKEELPGRVWSCPLLKKEFCEVILDELQNIDESNISVTRPNTMNNYGVVLGLIGLEQSLHHFVEGYLVPLVKCLFSEIADTVDASHIFTIKYREGLDLGLDMHTDDSDITINVCLGRVFEGSGLQFCGFMGQEGHRKASAKIKHSIGRCLIHLGRLRHGADDITSGERQNLIIWLRSTEYRLSEQYSSPPYQSETSPPDAVCTSFTHDRDYGMFNKYKASNAHLQGRGWCPPKGKEYPGFQQEPASCSACCDCGH